MKKIDLSVKLTADREWWKLHGSYQVVCDEGVCSIFDIPSDTLAIQIVPLKRATAKSHQIAILPHDEEHCFVKIGRQLLPFYWLEFDDIATYLVFCYLHGYRHIECHILESAGDS